MLSRATAVLGLTCAVSALVACGPDTTAGAAPSTFTVEGTLTLKDGSAVNYARYGKRGERCWGEQGYDDITEGAQVVIRDGDATRVALGDLGPGILIANSTDYWAGPCQFVIYVPDVPDHGGVYSVSVANRGEVSFRCQGTVGTARWRT